MPAGTSVGAIFVSVGADTAHLAAGLSRAEMMVERFGSRLFFMGSRITAGITTPIVGLGIALSRIGAQFDQSMTESLAIMDKVTPALRSRMEQVAKAIAETTKFSSDEAAKGYYHLASAGYTAQEAMKLLPVVAQFAQAGAMDLAKATEYLAGAQQALGMRMKDPIENAKEMQRVADVLTAANNLALGTVQDFAVALSGKLGPMLRVYHKDIEEGTAVLMAYASQNIKGASASQQAFMAYRDIGRFAMENASAWKKLGVPVFDAMGNMRNMGAIVSDLDKRFKGMSDSTVIATFAQLGFTQRTRGALQYLLGQGEAIKQYEQALRSAGGTAEEVANKQLASFTNQMAMLWHTLQNVGIELFMEFIPILKSQVVPWLERVIERIREWSREFHKMTPEHQKWVLGWIAAAAAIGPVITILGSFTLMANAIVGAFIGILNVVVKVGGAFKAAALAIMEYNAAQGALTFSQALKGMTAASLAAPAAGVAAVKVAQMAGPSTWGGGLVARSIAAAAPAAIPLEPVKVGLLRSAMAGLVDIFASAVSVIRPFLTGLGLLGGSILAVFSVLRLFVDTWGDWWAIVKGATGFGYIIEGVKLLGGAFSFLLGAVEEVTGPIGKIFEVIWNAGARGFGAIHDYVQRAAERWKQHWMGIDESTRKIETMEDKLYALAASPIPAIRIPVLFFLAAKEKMGGNTFADWLWWNLGGEQESADEYQKAQNQAARNTVALQRQKETSPNRLMPFPTRRPGEGIASGMAEVAAIPQGLDRAERQADFVARMKSVQDKFREAVGGFPEMPDKDSKAFENMVKEFQDRLDDGIGKRGKALVEAVQNEINILTKQNQDAFDPQFSGFRERVWKEWKPIRELMTPEEIQGLGGGAQALEVLTQEFQQMDMNTQFIKDVGPWWGRFADEMDGADPKAKALVKSFDEMGIYSQRMVDTLTPAWYEQNEEGLSSLNDYWRMMPSFIKAARPEVQVILDAFIAMSKGGKFHTDATAKAFSAMKDSFTDTVDGIKGQVTDLSTSLEERFSGMFSLKQSLFLTQRIAKAAAGYRKVMIDMLQKMAGLPMTEAGRLQQIELLKQIEQYKDFSDEMLRLMRVDHQERWAELIGFNQRMWKYIGNLSETEFEKLQKKIAKLLIFEKKMKEVIGLMTAAGTMFTNLGATRLGNFLTVAGAGIEAGLAAGKKMSLALSTAKKDWVGFAIAVMEGISAMTQSLQLATKGERALSMAMTGAAIGNSIVPVWGGLVGMGIGALWGALSDDPGWAQITTLVRNSTGVALSEGTAQGIADWAKANVNNDYATAYLMNLDKVLADAGGVKSDNIGMWAGELIKLFKVLDDGKASIGDVGKVFDTVFTQIADAVVASGGLASEKFRELIKLAKEFKLESAAVATFLAATMDRASTALSTLILGVMGNYTGLGDVLARAEEALASFQKSMVGKILTPEDQAQLAEYQKAVTDARAKQNSGIADTSKSLATMGRLILATFNGAVASGLSWIVAMEKIGPALDTIIQAYKDLGIPIDQIDNAAVKALIHFRDLVNANKDLVASMAALNELTQTLSIFGVLDESTLRDLEEMGLSIYDQMIKAGFSDMEALNLMAPFLKNIKQAFADAGIDMGGPLGDIVDRAMKAGLLGETDIPKILREGFRDLNERTKEVRDAIMGRYRYPETPGGGGGSGGGGGEGEGGGGGGEGGGGREGRSLGSFVGTAGGRRTGEGGAEVYTAGSQGDAAPITFNFTVNAVDSDGMRDVVQTQIIPIITESVRGNVRASRTDLRESLGVT